MGLYRGFALVVVAAAIAVVVGPVSAGATCDASAFHLKVTDLDGNPAVEPGGGALPAHRLPDSLINRSYFVNITITGGQPPYNTGYGGYSLPPGINKSVGSSPGTDNNDVVTIEGKASESYAASLILTVLDHNGCGPTPADSRFDWLYGQAPSNTGPRPSIPDPITVGDEPSCDAGGWTGDANDTAIKFSYQWRRTDSNGHATTVGSAQTLPTTFADEDQYLQCIVTATNRFGSAKATSNSVRVRASSTVLSVIRVQVRGWRKSGNVDWIGAGGPPGEAEPQDAFMPGEAALVTVTVENQGTVPSKPDTLRVWAETLPNQHDLTGLLSEDPVSQPIGAVEPGMVSVTHTVVTLSPKEVKLVSYRSGSTIAARFRAQVEGVRNKAGGSGDAPASVYALPAEVKSEKLSNPPSGFNVDGVISPPPLPPTEVVPQKQRPKNLEVSLLELGHGATAAGARPAVCKWVAGASGKRARRPATGRECATPIWLRARLHGHRWSFSLRHQLRRGRYVLYTRVVDGLGLYSPIFSAKDHTRRAFTVR